MARVIMTQERTTYEVIAERGEERRLVGYTPRKSGRGIWAMVVGNDPLIELIMPNEDDTFERGPKGIITTSAGWTVRFSGRTERSAQNEGELPGIV